MSIAASPVYAEVYEFLLSSPTPEQVIAFRASATTQEHVPTAGIKQQRNIDY